MEEQVLIIGGQRQTEAIGFAAVEQPEFDSQHGCFNDPHEIFLTDNQGVVMQQISQWIIVIILPLTTLIFVFAGI